MRTATTLHRTGKGWVLKYGPDIDAARQRAEFAAAHNEFPKGVQAIQLQLSDRPARTLDLERAQRVAAQLALAASKADQKFSKSEAGKANAAAKTAAEAKAAEEAEVRKQALADKAARRKEAEALLGRGFDKPAPTQPNP